MSTYLVIIPKDINTLIEQYIYLCSQCTQYYFITDTYIGGCPDAHLPHCWKCHNTKCKFTKLLKLTNINMQWNPLRYEA